MELPNEFTKEIRFEIYRNMLEFLESDAKILKVNRNRFKGDTIMCKWFCSLVKCFIAIKYNVSFIRVCTKYDSTFDSNILEAYFPEIVKERIYKNRTVWFDNTEQRIQALKNILYGK